MGYKGKHTGAKIDAQIDRVIDGLVVTDNTLHEVTKDDTKPVTGAAVMKGILGMTNTMVTPSGEYPVSGAAVFDIVSKTKSDLRDAIVSLRVNAIFADIKDGNLNFDNYSNYNNGVLDKVKALAATDASAIATMPLYVITRSGSGFNVLEAIYRYLNTPILTLEVERITGGANITRYNVQCVDGGDGTWSVTATYTTYTAPIAPLALECDAEGNLTLSPNTPTATLEAIWNIQSTTTLKGNDGRTVPVVVLLPNSTMYHAAMMSLNRDKGWQGVVVDDYADDITLGIIRVTVSAVSGGGNINYSVFGNYETHDVATLEDGKLPIKKLHSPMLNFEVTYDTSNHDVPLKYANQGAAAVADILYDMQINARSYTPLTVMLVMMSPQMDNVCRVPLSYNNGSWRGVVPNRLRTYNSPSWDEETVESTMLQFVEITLRKEGGAIAMSSKVRLMLIGDERYRDEMEGPVHAKEAQSFTEEEQAQARKNIGAVGSAELEKKADKTEYYVEMAVGTADNLRGRGEASEEVFTYRPSAGASDSITEEGVATMKSIKGNSVVWNQMCDFNNDSFTFGGHTAVKENGVYIISINQESNNNTCFQFSYSIPFNNHKWLAIAELVADNEVNIKGMASEGFIANQKCFVRAFYTLASNNDWYWGLSTNSEQKPTTVKLYNYRLFDLTLMFGAGNEPATIEDFYERIPSGIDINAYNEGQIIDLNTEAIKTDGFNQWDEQWTNGYLNIEANGRLDNNPKRIASTTFCACLPNTQYYIKSPVQLNILWFDDDKDLITYSSFVNNRTVISPNDARFFKINTHESESYGTTYKNDICLNISHTGVRNGEYEPYEERVHELPEIARYFPDGMKSAGSVYDEITESEATQRVGTVDLGELEWRTAVAANQSFRWSAFLKSKSGNASIIPNGLCNKYSIITPEDTWYLRKEGISYSANLVYLSITGLNPADIDNDPNVITQAMSGVMLNYELAEPIVTPLGMRAINLNYAVWDWGTERAVSSKLSAPFRANIIYGFNAVDSIRNNKINIEALMQRVAALEAKVSASEAKTVSETTNI